MLLRLLLVVGLLFAVVHVLPFAGPREARPVKTIVTNPETGHTYQIVWDHHSTWHEAREKARGMQCNGLPGHLATITSPEEQEFLVANFWNWHSGPLYMGASDADDEGVWKWVDGPEAGQVFFAEGHCVNGFSERWCANEPNNMGAEHDGGEDVAVWNWMGEASWNDVAANNRQHGYLVEFSPPESAAPKKLAAPRHTYLIRDLAPAVIAPAKSETGDDAQASPAAEVETAAKIAEPSASSKPEEPQPAKPAADDAFAEPPASEVATESAPAGKSPFADPPSVEPAAPAAAPADQPSAESPPTDVAPAEPTVEEAAPAEPSPPAKEAAEQPAEDSDAE